MDYHLTDDELEMVLAGEGPLDTLHHVQECDACRERLAKLAARERILVDALYRVSCPPSLALFDHATARSPSEQIAAHVAVQGEDCHACQDEIQALARWETLPLTATPERPTVAARVRRVMATLMERPTWNVALRGERAPRVYEVEKYVVTLDHLPSLIRTGRLALHGSLLALDEEADSCVGARVRLAREGAIVGECLLSPLGGFVFEGLTAGCYRLTLTLPDQQIVVDDLEVG